MSSAPGFSSIVGQSLPRDGGTWMLVGLAALTVLYVVVRPRARKKAGDPLSNPAGFAGLSQQRAVEREMQSLLVELSEMARQTTAQLDTRAKRLQVLIEQADDRLDQLRDATAAAAARPPGAPGIRGSPSPDRGPTAGATAASDAAAPEPASRMAPPTHPGHAEVYDLADQGLPHGEIARKLDRPSGEVELILALRPRA